MVEVDADLALIGPNGWACRGTRTQAPLDTLLVGPKRSVSPRVYLRDGDRVFETYWTKRRGVEAMDYSWALCDMTIYGRQEAWEDSPPGWPVRWDVNDDQYRTNGRPIAQWSRLAAGRSDDLSAARRSG